MKSSISSAHGNMVGECKECAFGASGLHSDKAFAASERVCGQLLLSKL